MRYKLLILLLLVVNLPAFADEEIRDSVRIDEVEVAAERKKHLSEGFQQLDLTQKQIENYSYRTLGEVLHYSTGVNIHTIGTPGASASISLRGLGASQTMVNWNGFPVNSVTLGGADVSIIPIMPDQSVSIVPGASGAVYGSGTFGGAVNIDYNSSVSKNNSTGVELSYGSMNSSKVAAGYNIGIKKLNLSGNIWNEGSDGDFKYFDELKQREFKRKYADYSQFGFQQYFSFKNSASSELKGGFWAQSKDQNIPAIEGASLENYENQKDSTLRLFLHYKKVFNSSSLNVKGAWFYADQHYTKKESDKSDSLLVDSRIKSKVWFGDINFRTYLFDNLAYDIGLTYNYTSGITDYYDGVQFEEVIGVFSGLKYNYDGLKANVAIRKDWGTNVDSDVLFDAGFSYAHTNKKLIIRGAYSQKFRRPTFNDMYWLPGGNPNIKHENGYSAESGVNYTLQGTCLGEFNFDLAGYYSQVNDMIVWIPEGANYYAKNYSDVLTRGVNLKVRNTMMLDKSRWHTAASLSYNKATVESTIDNSNKEGSPLYYSPEWISNINSGITTANKFDLTLNWQFTSKRFYDDSNNYLDPYWLLNGHISKVFAFNKHSLFALISVENILNKSYQTVRSYPMPGRIWQVKLKYSFN